MKNLVMTGLLILIVGLCPFGEAQALWGTVTEDMSWQAIQKDPYLKANFPYLKYSDAMGSHFISLRHFCLTQDKETFKSLDPVSVCEEVEYQGQDYRDCRELEEETLKIQNTYTTYSCRGNRCYDRDYSRSSYDRSIEISVRRFDPRGGGGRVLLRKDYQIPFCH